MKTMALMTRLEVVMCIAVGVIVGMTLVASIRYDDLHRLVSVPLPTTPPTLGKQVVEGCIYIVQLDAQKTTITSSYAAVGQPSTCLYDARKPR